MKKTFIRFITLLLTLIMVAVPLSVSAQSPFTTTTSISVSRDNVLPLAPVNELPYTMPLLGISTGVDQRTLVNEIRRVTNAARCLSFSTTYRTEYDAGRCTVWSFGNGNFKGFNGTVTLKYYVPTWADLDWADYTPYYEFIFEPDPNGPRGVYEDFTVSYAELFYFRMYHYCWYDDCLEGDVCNFYGEGPNGEVFQVEFSFYNTLHYTFVLPNA
ncbi:MAG: hypothetical protein MJ070_00135 [Lachnospiraceae bacterium]|nr:hypothetical protein [Lachnospiraceae bacterium]